MPFTLSKAHSILTREITKDTYIGLSTSAPTADGDNFEEPDPGVGYERVKFGDTYDSSVQAQVSNGNGIIFFNETTGPWGNVTNFGFFSSKTGGKPFFCGALTQSVNINAAEYVPIFRKNQLKIALDKAVE